MWLEGCTSWGGGQVTNPGYFGGPIKKVCGKTDEVYSYNQIQVKGWMEGHGQRNWMTKKPVDSILLYPCTVVITQNSRQTTDGGIDGFNYHMIPYPTVAVEVSHNGTLFCLELWDIP